MFRQVIEIIDEISFDLLEPSDNALVVYTARQILARIGFDTSSEFVIASAVSELSTNILRYAGSGTITMRRIRNDHENGFEVVARDQGPGIEDIETALKDNYSTGKGLGLGLPSVKRIMDTMEIWSEPEKGTCITARIWVR